MNKIDLNGRTAVVTGGAQGFGRAITERFVASGAKVAIWDHDQPLAEKTAKEIGAEVVFIGTARGIENRLVPQAGFELRLVEVGALNKVSLTTRLKTLFDLPRDRKSTRLNSSHRSLSRMPSSA